MATTLLTNYVTPKGEENIRNYKYKSQSDSLLYGLFLGPLANKCIMFTPETVSPNVITFIGFFFNLLCHFLIMGYAGDDLSAEVPRWLCIFTGFCHFLYMNFDNMDGKQARRTGTSSALGMLLDHGLDGVSSWIMGLNLAAAIRIGNSDLAYYAVIAIPLVGFFFTMWEEYHLDFLNFAFINPIDEGLTMMNSLIILPGIVGTEFWIEDGYYGFKKNECLLIVLCVVCAFTMLGNVARVVMKCKNPTQAFHTLKITAFLMACAFVIAYCSPSEIHHRRLRSLVTCFGLGFSKVIGHIQLAHCAGEDFKQWRKSFVASCVALAANSAAGFLTGKCPVDEDLLLNVAIVFNFVALLHYFFSMCQQLTRVLGIKVFTIQKLKAK